MNVAQLQFLALLILIGKKWEEMKIHITPRHKPNHIQPMKKDGIKFALNMMNLEGERHEFSQRSLGYIKPR